MIKCYSYIHTLFFKAIYDFLKITDAITEIGVFNIDSGNLLLSAWSSVSSFVWGEPAILKRHKYPVLSEKKNRFPRLTHSKIFFWIVIIILIIT